MGWYVIVNAKNLYFSGWRFRGSKPPLASWSNFHLAANKFHAIDSERADELCQLADALSGELMQIPDPPVDMRGEMWYNDCEAVAGLPETKQLKRCRPVPGVLVADSNHLGFGEPLPAIGCTSYRMVALLCI